MIKIMDEITLSSLLQPNLLSPHQGLSLRDVKPSFRWPVFEQSKQNKFKKYLFHFTTFIASLWGKMQKGVNFAHDLTTKKGKK